MGGRDEALLPAPLLTAALPAPTGAEIVAVGCGNPAQILMLSVPPRAQQPKFPGSPPGAAWTSISDLYGYQLQTKEEQNTINAMHHVFKMAANAGEGCAMLDMGANDG